jgi:hypothetical protein
MTFEHKLVVGLEEIKAIIFQCNECKSRIVLAPEDSGKPPASCPKGHAWDWNLPEEYETIAGSAFVFFLRALKKLRDPMVQRTGFKIFLEFDQPKS